MLRIQNHRLVGDGVTFRQTPNTGGSLLPRYVVLHYTAGRSLAGAVESLCTRKAKDNTSAHIVLGRDGRIVQLAPFNVVTWHAGQSQWNGLNGLNHHAIGIEMDNAGPMHREGDRIVSWFGKAYPEDEVVLAAHPHGGPTRPWHAYPELQIARALELCELLVAHYGLADVLGHEDIARGRKTDPGPAFPLASVRARALGRDADAPIRLLVTASTLNIRGGPGAQYAPLAPPLKKGTELQLIEAQDRWSQVAVVGETDLEGWVSNDFISRVPASRRGAPCAVLSRRERSVAPVAPSRAKAAAQQTAGKAARKAAASPSAARKTTAAAAATAAAKAAAKTTAKKPAASKPAARKAARPR